MKEKIIAKVAENLPSLITDIKTICNYDSRRDTATEDCPFGTRVVDCLNKALELASALGFEVENVCANMGDTNTEKDKRFIEELLKVCDTIKEETFNVYQYVLKVHLKK